MIAELRIERDLIEVAIRALERFEKALGINADASAPQRKRKSPQA